MISLQRWSLPRCLTFHPLWWLFVYFGLKVEKSSVFTLETAGDRQKQSQLQTQGWCLSAVSKVKNNLWIGAHFFFFFYLCLFIADTLPKTAIQRQNESIYFMCKRWHKINWFVLHLNNIFLKTLCRKLIWIGTADLGYTQLTPFFKKLGGAQTLLQYLRFHIYQVYFVMFIFSIFLLCL